GNIPVRHEAAERAFYRVPIAKQFHALYAALPRRNSRCRRNARRSDQSTNRPFVASPTAQAADPSSQNASAGESATHLRQDIGAMLAHPIESKLCHGYPQ